VGKSQEANHTGKPLPNDEEIVLNRIILKPVNEITFIRQIKVSVQP